MILDSQTDRYVLLCSSESLLFSTGDDVDVCTEFLLGGWVGIMPRGL